jgi:hypothetical protein
MAHHKKRNTAFLFEALAREGTKAIVEKDIKKADFIKKLMIKYFNPHMEMGKELNLYKSLNEDAIDKDNVELYLQEVKNRHNNLNKKRLFNEQTSLINSINKTIGSSVYNNFVPNYKNIATIFQIFNDQTPIKEKILLEKTFIGDIKLLNETSNKKTLEPVDKILYVTFAKKFNEKYSDLLSEQKDLLTKFVSSFADDGLEMKVFLNEEITRLKEGVLHALKTDEVKSDRGLEDKTVEVKKFLEDFKQTKEITQQMLEKILKIQQFVHEVKH